MEWLKETADLASANATEEDKILAMMHQSTKAYDPSNYLVTQTSDGVPPSGYICHSCNIPGHYIHNCTLKKNSQGPRPKRSAGIPASFLTPVEDASQPGALLLQSGGYAVPKVSAAAYKEKKIELPPFLPRKEQPAKKEKEIPDDLVCSLCQQLMTDAVSIVCCGENFCDECIRDSLLASETHTCPRCNREWQSPDRLVPNQYIRTGVTNHLNAVGYADVVASIKYSEPPLFASKSAESINDFNASSTAPQKPKPLTSFALSERPTSIETSLAPRICTSPQPIPTITGVYNNNEGYWRGAFPPWSPMTLTQTYPNYNSPSHNSWNSAYLNHSHHWKSLSTPPHASLTPPSLWSAFNQTPSRTFIPTEKEVNPKLDAASPFGYLKPRSRSNSPLLKMSRSRSGSPIHCLSTRRKHFAIDLNKPMFH